MFELKLQFLQDENYNLRRQVSSLQQVLAAESSIQQKSVLYQMSQTNDCLILELQTTKDQLLLEREAREIEKVEYLQIIQQLNRSLFELNQQISMLENIVREEKKFEYQPNFFEKWIKSKFDGQTRQIYHTYSDPVILFEVVEGILGALSEREPDTWTQDEDLNRSTFEKQSEKLQENIQDDRLDQKDMRLSKKGEAKMEEEHSSINLREGETKWRDQRSSLYFLKSKIPKDLHLNLSTAKLVQKNYIKAQESKEGIKPMLTTNVDLLKKSYVKLIGEHEIVRKKLRLMQRYAEELQNRNRILLRGRIEASLEF